jgi:hypothetical protein
MVGKTEGIALVVITHLGDGSLARSMTVTFGITGARAQIVVLKGTGIARR